MSEDINVHATALRLGERGLLLRGPSGSGKSSLALSLLRRGQAAGLDAVLVADDRTVLAADGARVRARPPAATAGLIEIRGIGILPERHVPDAILDLVVDLVPRAEVARMPDAGRRAVIAGITLPLVCLPERDPAFGADVLLTLVSSDGFWNGFHAG